MAGFFYAPYSRDGARDRESLLDLCVPLLMLFTYVLLAKSITPFF